MLQMWLNVALASTFLAPPQRRLGINYHNAGNPGWCLLNAPASLTRPTGDNLYKTKG
jgi:hypothetical protein